MNFDVSIIKKYASLIHETSSFLLDVIFPKFCLNCKQEGAFLCQDCFSLIEINSFNFCPFCRQPQQVIIGKCPKHQNFYLDGLFSATSFSQPLVQKLIKSFKYEPYIKELKKPLASLIVAHLLLSENKNAILKIQESLLTSIPISKKTKRKRGYNQTSEIARELSKTFHSQFEEVLIKTKNTPSQTTQTARER